MVLSHWQKGKLLEEVGRRGRIWHSPFRSSICTFSYEVVSLIWRFQSLSGLSVVVGIALARVVNTR